MGLDSFEGDWYHTGAWPHEGVDLTGKRVGVVGTGSSGVQSIPVIAKQAGHVTVFQRTPQYMIPARHGTVDTRVPRRHQGPLRRRFSRRSGASGGGGPYDGPSTARPSTSAPEERRRDLRIGAGSRAGTSSFLSATFRDIAVDRRANDTASEFIRSKIREIVHDPETAEKLLSRATTRSRRSAR